MTNSIKTTGSVGGSKPDSDGPPHVSSSRRIRVAAEGAGSSCAIRASYSDARSNSLFWVKGSACLARWRQRAAWSFKVTTSITHQPRRCIAMRSRHNHFRPVSGASFRIESIGSIRFPHGRLLTRSAPSALSLGGESAMPIYRAYLIDRDNRVSSYRPVEADTDTDALAAARQFVDGSDVEVWHLDRMIGRLERGTG